jgi:ParB family transcriptional regulator, chromosome partitioning protein
MVKRAPARRRPRKAKPGTKGLGPGECRIDQPTGGAAAIVAAIEKAGGCVVGSYKEPLGGHPLLLSVLPIGAVEPTPFQRDLWDAHHKRLADVINKTGRFLDPIIAVTAPNDGFWTPNGRHRLEAMRRLGAKSITALVVADREVAWQILALNTEKAHNLKERALEVVRIYRGLVEEDASRPESQFVFYLDEPARARSRRDKASPQARTGRGVHRPFGPNSTPRSTSSLSLSSRGATAAWRDATVALLRSR